MKLVLKGFYKKAINRRVSGRWNLLEPFFLSPAQRRRFKIYFSSSNLNCTEIFDSGMLRISKSNLLQFLRDLRYSNANETNRKQQADGWRGFTKFILLLISREIIRNSFLFFVSFNNLERLLIILSKARELPTSPV